jgi:lysophospholipase L1-like esterase
VLPLLRRVLRTHQEQRASQFSQPGPPAGHIVFLGDSITEFGLWNEWFPGIPVLNRGVSGEASAQVLRRLGTAINDPVATFRLIGTNDLATLVPIDVIAANVAAILAGIGERAPGAPVYVQSVMPRTARFRREIHELNCRYADLAAQLPPHVRYVDLWSALATADGALNPRSVATSCTSTARGVPHVG